MRTIELSHSFFDASTAPFTSIQRGAHMYVDVLQTSVPAARPTTETPPKIAHGINSLDQLRQLYKSAPDFGSLTGATQSSNDRPSSATKQDNRRSAYIASRCAFVSGALIELSNEANEGNERGTRGGAIP